MKIMNRILAGTMALSMTFSLAACGGGGDEKKTTGTTLPPVEVPTSKEALMDVSGQTITWMADYDLNPAIGKEKSAALTLFEDQCGGKIKYHATAWTTKFEDLSTAILSGDAPDIFPYHWIAFPSQVTSQFYQPIDDIVDFSTPLWADVAASAEQFVLNGDHYVAPLSYDVGAVLMYNKDLIEQDGLDDPMELYAADEWTWTKWEEIMDDFMAGDDAANPVRKALTGWYQPSFLQTTGQTMVKLVDGQFVNNLDDPTIERAQTFMYDLTKDNYYDSGWYGGVASAFTSGNILFYAMGTWAISNDNAKGLTAEVGLVPMPRDPNSDVKYTASNIQAQMWVKGSTKNDAVKTWFECNRVVDTDQTYADVNKQKTQRDNTAIDDEMYQILSEIKSSEFVQVFDYGYGISPNMGDVTLVALYENVAKVAGTSWTQLRGEYSVSVDQELKEMNKKVAAMS